MEKIFEKLKNAKKTTIFGVILFILSAFFAISLLLVVFDFGGQSSAHNNFIFEVGTMLSGSYGFCSILIPLFFLISALQMIASEWKPKYGVVLAGSIIPFFTLVAVEKICRIFARNNSGSVLGIMIFSALLLGFIIFAGEILLLSIFGDVVQERFGKDGIFNFDEMKNTKNDDFIREDVEPVFIEENDLNDDLNDDSENSKKEDKSKEDTINFVDMSVGDKILDFVKNDLVVDDLQLTKKKEIKQESENKIDESKTLIPQSQSSPKPENQLEENKESEEEQNPFAHIFDVVESGNEVEIQSLTDKMQPNKFEPKLDNSFEDFEESKDEKITFIENLDDEPQNFETEIEPEISNDESNFENNISNPEIENSKTETSFENPQVNLKSEIETSNTEDSLEIPQVNSESETENPKVLNLKSENYTDIFSLMDEDAAEEPKLKESVESYTEKLLESKKSEKSATVISNEPVLTEFENVKVEEENPIEIQESPKEKKVPFESLADAAKKALENAEKENYTKLEEPISKPQFDPTARPVVDSNGKIIQYDDLEDEINNYENALSDENEEFDEDVQEEVDDLNRAMNHAMNMVEEYEAENSELDEDEEADEESDEENNETPMIQNQGLNAIPQGKYHKGAYKVPFDLLDTYSGNDYWTIDYETRKAGEELKNTLSEFKIEAEVTGIRKGPAVTMYELLPAPGVKLSKIVALQDNIALRLAASSIRIVAPIPGKHAVGIEVPNKDRAVVSFREIIEQENPAFEKMAIPVVLGKDISGESQLLDLAKTPHLLIAGSTGSGKSVCVNTMLLSILFKRSPEQVKLVLVDPKIVELKLYNDIPHLLTPVITEPKRALQSLQYCLCEMERRYALLEGMGVRNIISYNKKIVEKHIATEKLPYIVVVIDEFADLMATTGKELETTIARLAAMSRAVGIHLVLATQRPSVDVITGLIKANIPSRIAFMVASKMDSRIIIDQQGADKLLGKGDMLYVGITDPFPNRIQGTLVSDDEVERVVDYVKGFGEPDYIDEEMFVDEEEEDTSQDLISDGDDPLYDQALQIVIQAGKASASYIQRRLKIGYNRAARLVEEMEARGIVGPANGSKPREIIHMP